MDSKCYLVSASKKLGKDAYSTPENFYTDSLDQAIEVASIMRSRFYFVEIYYGEPGCWEQVYR